MALTLLKEKKRSVGERTALQQVKKNVQLVKEQPCSKSWTNGRSPVVRSCKISA